MNREELLAKIKEENEYDYDPYEVEVDKIGWKIAAIGASVIALLSFLAELILFGKYNFGVYLVLVSMLGFKFAVQAFKFKNTFDIVIAAVMGVLFLALLVVYVISLFFGGI